MKRKKFKFGKLKVFVFDSREAMGFYAAKDAESRINKVISKKGEATIVFAAAPSQNELLTSCKNCRY